ncbi:MAG TPA: TlyA family RNA methyltransferase [Terriglobia bacterium]|nr:TlyA family RNA methyltransferase [Terriglobia bacterium]
MIHVVKPAKVRLDRLLVERGLTQSREKAQALILAGQVLIDEQKEEKCGARVSPDASIRLLGEPAKYVSRGGVKLEGALEHFNVDPGGKVCLDIGASTGGFTDCLLQHGAAQVFAVDAGRNQLDWKLRHDSRVVAREKTNARYLTFAPVEVLFDLVTVDVSFISATLILPVLPPLLKPRSELLVLVKPQFEVGRHQVGKGGIVQDVRLHENAIGKVSRKLAELGFVDITPVESVLPGASGNREYFLHAVWRKSD